MDYFEEEALVATLEAKIGSSSLNRAIKCKEPFDRPLAMVPVAYAMFKVLVDAVEGSGHDEDAWDKFLHEALDECINLRRHRYDDHI